MTSRRVVVAISLLGLGCGASSGTGGEGAPFTKAGGGGMSMGASAGTTNGGGGAIAGTSGGAGSGGSSSAGTAGAAGTAGTAGKGLGRAGSGGVEQSPGGSGGRSGAFGESGSGVSAGKGAGDGGGTGGLHAGGAGGAMGGDAGMDTGDAGAGPGPVIPDNPKQVEDPDALGEGPCASKSARDVLDAIHTAYPEFADVTDFYDPRYIGAPKLVYAYTSDAGFSMVLARGEGDCPGGCINWDYYYFQTDESCAPKQVGSYSAHSGPCHGYTVKGEPMWGMPDHTPTEICSATI